jgi:membrane-bound acyltransferase YfiQ involved in biofilm formation
MNCLKGVVVMVFILFPLVFHFGEAATKGTDIFIGGLYWQSLVFSLWEQLVGIGIIIVLLGLFKEKYTNQTLLLKNMSASAYTVYIFHSVILVLLALLIKNVELSATLKFIISAPIVLFLCFWISNLIRKLPFAKGIL